MNVLMMDGIGIGIGIEFGEEVKDTDAALSI